MCFAQHLDYNGQALYTYAWVQQPLGIICVIGWRRENDVVYVCIHVFFCVWRARTQYSHNTFILSSIYEIQKKKMRRLLATSGVPQHTTIQALLCLSHSVQSSADKRLHELVDYA